MFWPLANNIDPLSHGFWQDFSVSVKPSPEPHQSPNSMSGAFTAKVFTLSFLRILTAFSASVHCHFQSHPHIVRFCSVAFYLSYNTKKKNYINCILATYQLSIAPCQIIHQFCISNLNIKIYWVIIPLDHETGAASWMVLTQSPSGICVQVISQASVKLLPGSLMWLSKGFSSHWLLATDFIIFALLVSP